MKNLLLASIVAALCTMGSARAQTIVGDTFTGADDTVITSHSPNVNAPDGSYIGTTTNYGSPGTPGTEVPLIENDELQLDGTSDAAISISSNIIAGYVKPTTLTISANLTDGSDDGSGHYQGINPDSGFTRGIGLGFYSTAPSGTDYPISNFTGVILNALNGNLELFYPGADTQTTNHPYIAYDSGTVTGNLGTFSDLTTYKLSYTIDTSTGLVTSISLSDSTGSETASGFTANNTTNVANPPTVAFFTGSATKYAAVLAATNGAAPEFSYADNFLVTGPAGGAIPEPATYALLFAGVAMLIGYRRLKSARS